MTTSYSTSLISYQAVWQLIKGLLVSVWTFIVYISEQSYNGSVMDVSGLFLMHENILDMNTIYEKEMNIHSPRVTPMTVAPVKPILKTKPIPVSPKPIMAKQPSNLHMAIPIISITTPTAVEPSTPSPKLKKSPSKSLFPSTNTRFHQITPPVSPLFNFTFPAMVNRLSSHNLLAPPVEMLNTPPPQQQQSQHLTVDSFKSASPSSFHSSKKRLSFSAFSYETSTSIPSVRGRAATIQTTVPKPVIEIKRIKSNSHM